MKYSLYLGQIAGVKIYVHWTFLILVVWIIFSNANANLGIIEILWSLLFIAAVFACITFHELGHATAAKRYRIVTRKITLLPIGGLAQMEEIPQKPKEELIIALAGPLVNLVIALVLWPLARLTYTAGELNTLQTIGPLNFIPALLSVNLLLALFNLIPAFPMDGGRVLRALLAFKLQHVKATRIAASVGQILAIGFVFLGFVYNPFLVFIGLFIFLGAQSEAIYAESKSVLQGYTVQDVLMHDIPMIDDHSSVKDAADLLLNGQNKNFVVTHEGKPVGTLNRDTIIKAMEEKGGQAFVEDLKNSEIDYFPIDMPLDQAWGKLQQKKDGLALVVSDGELKGVIDPENVAEFIQLRTAQHKYQQSVINH